MRHLRGIKRLGRTSPHRIAMLRNMATSLFRHERIQTTAVKAKVLRSYAEKLITLGKRGDLASRRLAARDVHDKEILRKLFGDLAERFRERAGGYTRVLHMGYRHGDAADMSLIELVDYKPRAAGEAAGDEKPGKAVRPAKVAKAAKPEVSAEAKADKAAAKAAAKSVKAAAKTEKAAAKTAKVKAKADAKPAKVAAKAKGKVEKPAAKKKASKEKTAEK